MGRRVNTTFNKFLDLADLSTSEFACRHEAGDIVGIAESPEIDA